MDERLKEIKVRLTDGNTLSYPSPTDGACYLKAKYKEGEFSLDDDGTHIRPGANKLIITLYDSEDKELKVIVICQDAIFGIEMTKLLEEEEEDK